MDKKYIGKQLPLPKETHESLSKIREELTATLGFEPSLSETVAFLCKKYNDSKAQTV